MEKNNSASEAGEKIEKMAAKLEVRLPEENLPLPLRIVILLMVVGGLSIIGSAFTDFVAPKDGGPLLHLLRLATGGAFLAIAYGLDVRERWASWLYGVIVLGGLIFNFSLAIVPALLAVYLYTERKILKPCFMDKLAQKFFDQVRIKSGALFKRGS